MKAKIIVPMIFVALALTALFFFSGQLRDCNDSGGVLVKAWDNTYQCIHP